MRERLSRLAGAATFTGLAAWVVVLTAGAAGAAPAPVHAAPRPAATVAAASIGFDELQNKHTGACLDDSFSYGLRAIGCNGLNYQSWTLYPQADGSYKMVNSNTGRCVDDSFTYHLRSLSCGGNCPSCQSWLWLGIYDGGVFQGYAFKNENTNGCIDDSFHSGLRSYPCNYLDYQTWNT